MGQYITQDELGGILAEANKHGLEPGKVVENLVKQGADIEGFGQHAIANPVPAAAPVEAPHEPSTLNKMTGGLIGDDGTPDSVRKAEASKFMNDVVLGDGRMSNMTMAGQMMNGLQGVAELGKKSVEGWKALGGLVGPKTEAVAGGVANALLPTSKMGAALAIAGGAGELEGAASKALAPAESLAGRVKVVKPNVLEKAAGGLIQATARVPERFGSAVVADPTILDESVTPGLKAVSKEMGDYFEKKGVNINRSSLKDLFKQSYVPSDNQVGKLNKMVEQTIGKLENNLPVSEEELIFSERAANAMSRSTQAQTNKYIMSNAKGAQKVLLDHLDKAGFTELPELKAKYFRALAQDSFQDWLPRNKTGGPNALSALLMGKEGLAALGHLAQGNIGNAMVSGTKAAAFSPILVGQGIRAASKVATSPAVAGAAKGITWAALNEMLKNKDEKK